MSDWKTLSSEDVYSTPWFTIRKNEVLNQSGKHLTYSFLDLRHPSVYIITLNNRGEIFLQKNYTYPPNITTWDIPAGHADGQDPIEAGKRELLEETGLTSNDWAIIGRQYQTTGTTNSPFDIVVAKDVQKTSSPTDELEDITKQSFFSLQSIESMIANGQIIDASVIGSVYTAKLLGII